MILLNKNQIRAFEKILFGFVVLFLLTLTNSIFLNQIGYYGALLGVIILFIFSDRNKFEKTKLEIPFLLFILAEIISSILSINKEQAFQNALKRFLLIPIV